MANPPESPTAPDPGSLRLKPREHPEQEKLREASAAAFASASAKPHKKQKRGHPSFAAQVLTLTLGPCLLGLVILGLFLAHQVLEWEILSPEQASLTRNIAIGSFLAVIILEAFSEDLMQGVLCFFLPPYMFIYALFFSDAGPIRGLTIAVLIFLGAEMALQPEEALVPVVQTTLNDWIRAGQDKLINPDGRPDAGYNR